MRTHVDTAIAIRRHDSDLFMVITPAGAFFRWAEMGPTTAFFDENDEERIPLILASHPEAEVVRVSRVIDIVDFQRPRLRVAG